MASLPLASPSPLPTDLAALPKLLAYTQRLGLNRYLHRPKRGIPTLALALLWLSLAWRGSGRPYHLRQLNEPLLAALIGRHRLPSDQTLYRSLTYCSAKALRRVVEEAYLRSRDLCWLLCSSDHQLRGVDTTPSSTVGPPCECLSTRVEERAGYAANSVRPTTL